MPDYHEDFPKIEGPPSIGNNTSTKVFSAKTPVYTIELDAGAMRAVWEVLESEAHRRYPVRSTMTHVQALIRGVESFRAAYWAKNARIEETRKAEPKKTVRRVGKAQRAVASPQAAPARIVRRIRRP